MVMDQWYFYLSMTALVWAIGTETLTSSMLNIPRRIAASQHIGCPCCQNHYHRSSHRSLGGIIAWSFSLRQNPVKTMRVIRSSPIT